MFVVHVGGELNGGVRRIICSAVKGARLLHACCHVTHFFRTAERILGVVGQGYQPTVSQHFRAADDPGVVRKL
jgi:hypothetical protein